MMRTKVIKKSTRNKNTLLKNLRKGKARKEPRCAFANIPHTTKFNIPEVFHLYGDIVLVETNGVLGTEPSLLNRFMVFKNTQVTEMYKERVLRVLIEMKDVPFTDWKQLVARLDRSEQAEHKEWSHLIKTFSERYEEVLKRLGDDCDENGAPNSVIRLLKEINQKTEEVRQNMFKNYPCMEFKSQVIGNHIKLTEIMYNERMLGEIGHSVESFASIVVQEGLPKVVPFDNECSVRAAKWRLENHISIDRNGTQSPEIEACIYLKNGFMKKVKAVYFNQATYEKGVPGFSIIVIVIARKSPYLEPKTAIETQVSKGFVEEMATKEKQRADFLSTYYNHSTEKRYSNFDKICKVRELKEGEENEGKM